LRRDLFFSRGVHGFWDRLAISGLFYVTGTEVAGQHSLLEGWTLRNYIVSLYMISPVFGILLLL